MAAWGKSREEREREHHEAIAKLEADQAELRKPDAEGPGKVFVRSVFEEFLWLLGGAVICAVGAVIGAVVAGTLGLFIGFLVGLVVCGIVAVVGFGYGAAAWRREYKRRS